MDVDVCSEGLRLARLLRSYRPTSRCLRLSALILLTEARRPARSDAAGRNPVADQDRALWDSILIAEGIQLLDESLRRTQAIADPYQLQAAIAAEHARASSYDATDWAEIVRLYDLLLTVAPSGPGALSRAVAIAERDGAEAGLAALRQLSAEPRLEAVRSELLARAGRYAEASTPTNAVRRRDRAGTPLAGNANDPIGRGGDRPTAETLTDPTWAHHRVAERYLPGDHGELGARLR
jgi:RNA polymerase sigma-70 factor (ECF subfamily)